MVVRVARQGIKPTRVDPGTYLDSSDEALMLMFQAGDDLAFHALLERHIGLFWRVVKTVFGTVAEIDDLIQDIHLTLWKNRQAWQPGKAKFSTWLYKVAFNRCVDIQRSRQIQLSGTSEFLAGQVVSTEKNPEENFTSHQLANELKKLLKELPGNQRLALELYYYEDIPLPTIADRLEISEVAARALIKRGKQQLRASFSV